ncbi:MULTISPECIES: hypothetical protein [unclassified Paenibacillus]|uniref:hypothetical protein n=1 Tax=unclassified Paenibacillus TaxID=185978 RepID=UPI001AEB6D31|nr:MULTISPECIES: hypothetical protein [unclassified Paenibacillus]MBP1154693.1 hypothetical protein [Paenibacillus sp. PvP091]MBP1169923.1 hypothetical protein [Paenibacillus sp. PvR098]MBP2440951.1 hypothetical protein [Paenibacillus sp. PvP052]
MENEDIRRLELQFGRRLTEGEAAEILNEQIVHPDDEEFFDEMDDAAATLATTQIFRRNL